MRSTNTPAAATQLPRASCLLLLLLFASLVCCGSPVAALSAAAALAPGAPRYHLTAAWQDANATLRYAAAPYHDPLTGVLHVFAGAAGPSADGASPAAQRWLHFASSDGGARWRREVPLLGGGQWYAAAGVGGGSARLHNNSRAAAPLAVLYGCGGRLCAAAASRGARVVRQAAANPLLPAANLSAPSDWWSDGGGGAAAGWMVALARAPSGGEVPLLVAATADASLARGYAALSGELCRYPTAGPVDAPELFPASAAAGAPHVLKLSLRQLGRDVLRYGAYAPAAAPGAAPTFTADGALTDTMLDLGDVYAARTLLVDGGRRRLLWAVLGSGASGGGGEAATALTMREAAYDAAAGQMRVAPAAELKALRRRTLVLQRAVALSTPPNSTGAAAEGTLLSAAEAPELLDLTAVFTVNASYFSADAHYADDGSAPAVGLRLRGGAEVVWRMPATNRSAVTSCLYETGGVLRAALWEEDTANPARCSELCARERLCVAWDLRSGFAGQTCTLFWQPGPRGRRCDTVAGRPNVPQLWLLLPDAAAGGRAAVGGRAAAAPGSASGGALVLRLRVLLDRGTVEAFKDDGLQSVSALAGGAAAEAGGTEGVTAFARNVPAGEVSVVVSAYEMSAAWAAGERETAVSGYAGAAQQYYQEIVPLGV